LSISFSSPPSSSPLGITRILTGFGKMPLYVVTIALIFILCVTAAITKRERFHAAFAIFVCVYILLFIAINLSFLV
jgi:hypothetical protein